MTVHGVDVASYQPTNFPTSGQAFAFVKATEGTGYVNPLHAAQVAHARATGLLVGHYHFARPGSAADQSAYFLKHAAPKDGDLLALDWEDEDVSGAAKDALLRRIQQDAAAHRVLLYCNRDFWLNRDTTSFCGDGLWIADPSSSAGHPRVQHAWTVHQYSSSGGIDHNVAAFADRAALAAWAAKTTSTSPQEDDDMPTAQEIAEAVWQWDGVPASRPPYQNDDYDKNKSWVPPYALQTGVEAGRQTLAIVKQLTAQVAALTAAVGALAKDGGITAEQIQAAAQAGAQAALAELGDRLQPPAAS